MKSGALLSSRLTFGSKYKDQIILCDYCRYHKCNWIKAIPERHPNICLKPKIIVIADEYIPSQEFERRIEIEYTDIPDVLKEAIIATEDPRFYKHKGIDFRGILRALKEDVKLILTPRKLQGGSTISQQLARELFLHRKQTIRRKLKEVLLALQIEKRYFKVEAGLPQEHPQ